MMAPSNSDTESEDDVGVRQRGEGPHTIQVSQVESDSPAEPTLEDATALGLGIDLGRGEEVSGEDLCGTYGCSLPDKHPGLHRLSNVPLQKRIRRRPSLPGGSADDAVEEEDQDEGARDRRRRLREGHDLPKGTVKYCALARWSATIQRAKEYLVGKRSKFMTPAVFEMLKAAADEAHYIPYLLKFPMKSGQVRDWLGGEGSG